MAPETRYARSGETHIAYQVSGQGPIDILWVPTWIWESEHVWEEPAAARLFRRLGSFSRLITFDRRGSGLSDPVVGAPTLEEQMDDVVAVLAAAGSQRAAVLAQFEAGAMACMFAATHPELTGALILYEATPRMTSTDGYEWPLSREEREANEQALVDTWGDGSRVLPLAGGHGADERLRKWAGRLERLAASPSTARSFYRMHNAIDVRPVLPQVQAPTLVLHRPDDPYIDIRHSRWIADHVRSARLVELSGNTSMIFGGDQDELLGEVEEFLTGARHAPDAERVLSTVMFTDIVDSTRLAAEAGDTEWRQKILLLEAAARRELEHLRGQRVKTLGDGFLATFDGPARAIRCALAMRDVGERHGLEVRSGLHTGEIELLPGDVGGLAVHIASRVTDLAGPSEVLVSGTVKDLVVGSGITFAERGEHELRGIPDRWRLWSVVA